MTTKKILLIDNDSQFGKEFAEALQGYPCEFYQTDETLLALDDIKKINPDVLVIAAELPKKMGYALCNKIRKSIAPSTPIVLTTSSLPTESFNQHSKLKYRADDYFDKRLASASDLVRAVQGVYDLGGPIGESIDLEVEDFSDLTNSEEFDNEETQYVFNEEQLEGEHLQPGQQMTNGLNEEGTIDESVADVHMEQTSILEPAHSASSAGHDESFIANESLERENHSLLEKINSLKNQLSSVQSNQSDASNGSLEKDRELLTLREKLNQKEKDILDLKDQIDSKDLEVLSAKEKLRDTERSQSNSDSLLLNKDQEVLTLKEEIASWMVKEKTLSEQVFEISESKNQSSQENEEKLKSQENQHSQAIATLQSEHEQQRESLVAKQNSDVEELKAQFEEQKSKAAKEANDRQNEHIAKALEEQNQQLQEAQSQQIEELRQELAVEFSEKEHQLNIQKETLVKQQEQALVDLQDKQNGQLTRLEREAAETSAQLKTEKETEVQFLAMEWQEKLDSQLKLNEENQRTFVENEATLLQENENASLAWQNKFDEIELLRVAKEDRIQELQTTLAETNQTLASKNEAIESHVQSLSSKTSEIEGKQTQIEELENRLSATESRLMDARNDIRDHRDINDKAKKAMAIALTLLDQNDMDTGSQPVGTNPGEEATDSSKLS